MTTKNQGKLKIAIIAPPWLSLYPGCYYGIENVVHNLTSTLTEQGHHVELFTVKGSTTLATKRHWYHEQDQYKHIHRPFYEVASVIISHILYALNTIRKAGDFDIIHDHNSFMGPALMANANSGLPPILHTLHEPFTEPRLLSRHIPDNRLMFDQFQSIKHLYFNAVSAAQLESAPSVLTSRIKGVVYNAINPQEYAFTPKKKDYFLSVASISPNKGQGTAAKICHELGAKFVIAGTIGGTIETPAQLAKELNDPLSTCRDDVYFNYFKEEITPYLVPGRIKYVGTVTGTRKQRLFEHAKALLFPIDWEEPFGVAAIEALACGTPVVAFKRGALPEIIEHGVNGFLARTQAEFKHYMQKVDEIDPAACRESVERKFSAGKMASDYVRLYQKIIAQTKPRQA